MTTPASSAAPVEVGREDLDRWCRTHLGAGIDHEVFRQGHLSMVIGVRLSSGSHAVVKVRHPSPRLAACAVAHRLIHARGYPCPEPLVEGEPLGEWVASAEAMVLGGELFPDSARGPGPFAQALAWLVSLAPEPNQVGPLDPPLPWTSPDPTGPVLWPWPDDCDVDLNQAGGPAWIEEAGRVARDRIERCDAEPVVGHGDWHTANLRWAGRELSVAFDWDSVIAAPEAVVAGLAAATYPTTHEGTEATIEETEGFLAAYSSARGQPLSSEELEVAWAAGLWNRSFDAKKQCATEGRPRSLTEAEALERRARAGLLQT